MATALSLAFYARHLPRRIATFVLILSCCQFHIAFWAGRTLPNMVAFPIVQVALVHILFRDQLVGFTMLACCASVLRGDLLPLLLSLLPLLKVGRLRARPLLASAAVFAVVLGAPLLADPANLTRGRWLDRSRYVLLARRMGRRLALARAAFPLVQCHRGQERRMGRLAQTPLLLAPPAPSAPARVPVQRAGAFASSSAMAGRARFVFRRLALKSGAQGVALRGLRCAAA
jgi:hypothetical protein